MIKLFLFFIVTTLIVIFFNWGLLHSQSIDLVSHNSLVNKILVDGEISGGYQENLLGMEIYPPLAHYLAASIGFLFDSSLLGMNIVVLIAGVIIFSIIGYFLLEIGLIPFLLSSFLLYLLYTSKIILPLIGYEVIGNFFFAQFISTAYFLAILLWLYRNNQSLIIRLIILIILINIGLCMYVLPIVILFGASIIVLLMELHRDKSFKKNIVYIIIYILITGGGALINPYCGAMVKIAKNEGYLSFAVLTTSPTDITIWVIYLIILAVVLGLSFIWNVFHQNIKTKGTDRAILFLTAVLVSTAGLSFFQYILYLNDLSNAYAVKKYLFILFTFFIILITSQVGVLLKKVFLQSKQLSLLVKYNLSVPLVFVFASLFVFGIFNRPGIDLIPILKYQKQVKSYLNLGSNVHDTISQLPIHHIFNLLITSAELEHPWDDVSKSIIGWGAIDKKTIGKVVIPSSDSNYISTIYNSGAIAVVNSEDYFTINVKNGETLIFNSPLSNKYIVSGFSDPEPWGRWSLGDHSKIEIDLNIIKEKEISLQFLVSPFLNQKHNELIVEVYVNGQKFDDWDFSMFRSYPENKQLIVPSSLVGMDNKLGIQFIYKDAVSPQEIGLSSDSRKIALGLISLKVGIK